MGKYMFQALFTPDEKEGGYTVTVPQLPGCLSEGETLEEAAAMAADAMKTYVASLLSDGRSVPEFKISEAAAPQISLIIFFETDEKYVFDGPMISAAQAAREIGVTPARVTHMIDSGLLEGYREGRRTWVSQASVDKRRAAPRKAGRPRRAHAEA